MKPSSCLTLCRSLFVCLSIWIGLGSFFLFVGCSPQPPPHGMNPPPPVHGVEFVLSVGTGQPGNAEAQQQTIQQMLGIIRKRLDHAGATDAHLQATATNSLVIQIPAASTADKVTVQRLLQKPGRLEFRLVHEQSRDLLVDKIIPEGFRIMTHLNPAGPNAKPESYVVNDQAELAGGVKQCQVIRNNLGRPEISFLLDDNAAKAFADVTARNIGRQLAIVLDAELQTAPVINSAITGGAGVITGKFTDTEAADLANALESPLVAPTRIVGERSF